MTGPAAGADPPEDTVGGCDATNLSTSRTIRPMTLSASPGDISFSACRRTVLRDSWAINSPRSAAPIMSFIRSSTPSTVWNRTTPFRRYILQGQTSNLRVRCGFATFVGTFF
jgi:hypothetical protein